MAKYKIKHRHPQMLIQGQRCILSAINHLHNWQKALTYWCHKLFMFLQASSGEEIDDFLKYEVRCFNQGKLNTGTKASLLKCLPGKSKPGCSWAERECSLKVFVMSGVIHMVNPQCIKEFDDYTDMYTLLFKQKNITHNTTTVDEF